jgi:myo-inositol 2-dehydrogenase/D-chiro-inositol 1-dehydrogenase
MPQQQERNVSGIAPTRRDFMKASAAIAGAAALAIPASGVFAQASAEIKIGLIGCGGRGSGAANQALHTNSSVGPCKLIAVADAFKDQADRAVNNLKNEHGDKVDVPNDHVFVGFDAYKQVIEAGPDMLVIATPPGFRPIHFEAAIKAGKHVFMEKPVATDAVGIRKVLEVAKLAKEKNLKVGVGLQRHHQQMYIDNIKRVQDGAIGDLILMRAYWNGDRPWVRPRAQLAAAKKKAGGGELTEMEYQMRNWYYFNWLCGDHINEQHIHNLDVINWVKNGHPVLAQGVGGRAYYDGPDQGEIFDHHMIEYTYADGSKLMSECRHQPNTWQSVSEHVHGTKGYADLSGGSLHPTGGEVWRYRGQKPDPYQVEHDDISKAIRNNLPYNEAEYGAHSTMTAIMGRMATYSGVEIFWDTEAAQKANKKDAAIAMESTLNLQPESYAWDAKPRSLPDANGLYRLPRPGDKTFRAF